MTSLSAAGLTGVPSLVSASAATSVSGPTPAPKGSTQPDPQPVSATDAASKWPMPKITFPAAGSWTVPVGASAVSSAGVVGVAAPSALGSLGLPTLPTGREPQPDGLKPPLGAPVWAADVSAATPSSVKITTLGDAARQQVGGAPMVFTVDRADGAGGTGPVAVSVNYAGFRDAYGGNYAERLELVRYPACVLTTPELPDCSTGTPVANQVNNPYQTALTAVVDANGPSSLTAPSSTDPADATGSALSSGSVFAVTSSPSGPSGTYIASPLLPSAHWAVGLSSGSLGYSYPITAPVPPGGPAPSVTLDYDSGSVDGHTSATNPQASWVGLGWDYQPGFIEREYTACNSLSGRTNADLCYTTSPINISLSLGGMTTHIIQDADGTWRLQDDPGWSVTHGTGAGNDDVNGEFWKLQSPDGTIYYFGRGVGIAGTTATKSVWTVPVFGYPGGTLCTSYCSKAWRWNLDYVVRTNNNETTYYYAQETNAYNVNGVSPAQSYVRGGRLTSITYGLLDGDSGSSPVDKVVFTTAGRCTQHMNGGTTACPTLGPGSATSYPDAPVDLVCVTGALQCTQKSPSFWISNMLTDIDTYVLSTSPNYQWLDHYGLTHQLPDPDGSSGPEAPSLWMSRVQHTGEYGTPASTPPLNLFGDVFPNRFDVATGVSPVDMYRVDQIENETGGYLDITYDTPDVCTTALENGDHSLNYLDCFPVHWVPKGSSTWAAGWFNKYLVTRTGEYIPYLGESPHTTATGATSEPIVTDYVYVGGAAWHKNTFEVNPTLSDSWSVYRGYQTVRVNEDVVSGTVIGSSYESVTFHQFYRGMYGDLNNDGSTKTNTVSTAEWGPANDYSWLAGREAEVMTETAGSTVLSTTDTNYWADQTASMAMVTPNPTEVAKEVRPYTTMIRTPNSDGTTRRHEIVDLHYESSDPRGLSNGAVIRHIDAGDMAGTDAGANCTSIVYVANPSRFLLEPEVSETDAGRASGSDCLGTVLSHQEFFYDQITDSSTPPTQGNLRRVKAQLTSAPVYANTYADYDGYGRVLHATDANGHVTTTTYTPSTGRPASVKVDAPPLTLYGGGLKLSTTTTLDLRGMATQTVDVNGQTATQTFDALGRLTAARAPTEVGGPYATFTAAYALDDDAWSTVHTKTLLTSTGIYRDTWTYLDGWQRVREVHTPAYGGLGHVTEQARFDDTGEVTTSSSPYLGSGAIGGGADQTAQAYVPLEVEYGYDALHRVTVQTRTVNGTQQSWGHTLTSYKADQIVTTPPSPAPVTTATIDVWGRVSASREDSQVSGDTSNSTTTSTYDPLGRLLSVADNAGNSNHYTYDLAGRRVSATDADAGASTSTYDAVGNLQTTVDARGDTVTTVYDELNRPVSISADGHTNAAFNGTLVDYTYDDTTATANGKGRPKSVTVHDLGNGTTNWTSTVGGYDADGRVSSTTYDLPPVSGLSSGISYTTSTTYNPDGGPATVTDPALGDQPAETMTYGYDTSGGVTGLPLSMSGPFNATAGYTNINQLTSRTYGDSASSGYTTRSYGYGDPLRRLSNVTTTVTHNAVPQVQNDTFSYDNLDEPTRVNGGAPGDSGQQTCFTYDGLDRLKRAWTEATDCNSWTATTAAGPYGFNQQFAYDPNGTPTSVTNLGVGVPYTPDTGHPHAIASYGTTNAYTYDADGQQSSRTISGTSTTMSWDPLHHLYQSVSGASTMKYVNGADGTRIARLDPDGSTTIWVAGHEVHVANGVVTATRYYSFAGATIAQRNASGLTWLASDGQNSRQIAVDATTGAATRTYYLPYGAQRTGAPLLPTDQNFLGRVLDSSGLLQDGARYYDPGIGQFISPDPLVNASDNSAMDPYGYAADNPLRFMDLSGLMNQPEGSGGAAAEQPAPGAADDPDSETTLAIAIYKNRNGAADATVFGFTELAKLRAGMTVGAADLMRAVDEQDQENAILANVDELSRKLDHWTRTVIDNLNLGLSLLDGVGAVFGILRAGKGVLTGVRLGLRKLLSIGGRRAGTDAAEEGTAFGRALSRFPKAARLSKKPPGFDPQTWQWRDASRNIPEKHWWDPEGGEWRYHPADKWHGPHWDYNPWTEWNSPWQHIYPESGP